MAQLVSPSRVPFGMLDDSRLQRLTSIKNKQNALAPSSSVLSKRKLSDPFASDMDSENLDPSHFSPKKSKLSSGNALKSSFSKSPSHFVLKTDFSSSLLPQAPSISQRAISTPKRASALSLDNTPRTAPAGRSPRRKRASGTPKRRTSAPFTRINPPSLSSSSLPFSIDAALSGSVPSYQPVPQSAPAPAPAPAAVKAWQSRVPDLDASPSQSSWFFDIHEDTPEQELGNLMEFSTSTLDISDGETRADRRKREMEERGKENIPPEMGAAGPVAPVVAAPVSRRDAMTDEPRTPLGELEASEFYADGCDVHSVVIVPTDGDDGESAADGRKLAAVAEEHELPCEPSPTEAKGTTNQDAWRELLARVDEQQKSLAGEMPAQQDVQLPEQKLARPSTPAESVVPELVALPASDDDIWAVEATSREEAPLFDIWESESAKEEGEELDALAA